MDTLPNRKRLFVASCAALVATSIAFSLCTDVMPNMKEEFLLSDEQTGMIGGAALWGFAISIILWGMVIDALGMRTALWVAFFGHAIGTTLIVFLAGSFWPLYFGWLIIALSNGMVEASINPLAATIYPDKKTHMLNVLHAWWPGGLIIGGLLGFLLSVLLGDVMAAETLWRFKVGFIFLPTLVYGGLLLGQKFPQTERVQAAVPTGDMFKEALRPGFLILLLCMFMTASMELGPDRWIKVLTEKLVADVPGILVLVYTAGLMFVLRFFAGPLVHRLSAMGLLIAASVVSGLGLIFLSYSTTGLVIFIAATVFGIGKAYFWPTMLGTVAERHPKGGAFLLALMGGGGMAIVGLVSVPVMGSLQDHYFKANLSEEAAQVVIEEGNIDQEQVQQVRKGEDEELKQDLRQADKEAASATLRWVACLAIVLIVIFSGILIHDKTTGRGEPEALAKTGEAVAETEESPPAQAEAEQPPAQAQPPQPEEEKLPPAGEGAEEGGEEEEPSEESGEEDKGQQA